jgi:Cys-tRNA(Pro) deacylase
MAKGTPATVVLVREKVAHTLHPYEVATPDAPHYGMLVAEALGVDPDHLYKTLVTEVDGALTVAVVPVTGELDLKALAAAAGGKRAALADRAVAERTTGYVRGGISPLGQRRVDRRPGPDVRVGGPARPAGLAGPGRPGPAHRRHGQPHRGRLAAHRNSRSHSLPQIFGAVTPLLPLPSAISGDLPGSARLLT